MSELDFTVVKNVIIEDVHKFNTQPGFDNASVVANGSNYATILGCDTRYESGSHTFKKTNGSVSLCILDSKVVLSNLVNAKFFAKLLNVGTLAFSNPAIQPNNASKMSLRQVNIKLWRNSNKLTSIF